MSRSLRPALLGLLALAVTACGSAVGGPDATAPAEAARVADTAVQRAELTERVADLLALQEEIAAEFEIEITPQLRQEAVGQIQSEQLGLLINRELALAAARELGITDAEIEAAVADNEAGLLAETGGEEGFAQLLRDNGLSRDVAVEVVLVGAAARQLVEARVTDDITSADTLPTREVRHILVPDLDEAQDIIAELRAGGDFAALAQQRSQDPGSGALGGDLGESTRGAFVGPFDDAVWEAEVGELLGPVETQFGFHIIEVTGEGGLVVAEAGDQQLAQAASSEVARLLGGLSADVTVDPAFGTWDATTQTVQPTARVGGGAVAPGGLPS